MIFIEYSFETQVSGFLTLIAVMFSLFLGLNVLKRAINTHERILYLFSLTLICAFTPWYPTAFGYLYWIFTNQSLSYEFYIILGLAFSPIGIVPWIDIYMSKVFPKKRNLVLISYTIFSVVFEIYLFYYLLFAPNAPVQPLLGTVTELRTEFKGFLLWYALISVLIVCLAGIHFGYISLKQSTKGEIQWKGKFLIVGFILFLLELILDSILPSSLIVVIIVLRILLIIVIIVLYIGFLLPDWIKNRLSLKE
ncbi:MAG: hypothetical protein ACFFAO_05115 [Candidatus Hermodarchaeota archaeon]